MKILCWLSPFIVLTCLALFLGMEGTLVILFGWIPFLGRVIPQWTVDVPTLAVGAIALVLFTFLVHAMGRKSPRWTARRTVGIVVGILILFAAGISVVGMSHQIAWLAASDEPLQSETLSGLPYYSSFQAKQIGIGLMNVESAYGTLPAGGTFTADGRMLHSWEKSLLPFIGCDDREINTTLPWNHPTNQRFFKGPLRPFINPGFRSPQLVDADGYGLSHYASNVQVMGANTKLAISQITDGTSNTIAIGEVNSQFQPWGHPVNWRDPAVGLDRAGQSFGGPPRTNRTTFIMTDGSVRSFNNKIDPTILRALSTPNGGEQLPGEEELNR